MNEMPTTVGVKSVNIDNPSFDRSWKIFRSPEFWGSSLVIGFLITLLIPFENPIVKDVAKSIVGEKWYKNRIVFNTLIIILTLIILSIFLVIWKPDFILDRYGDIDIVNVVIALLFQFITSFIFRHIFTGLKFALL